MLTQESGKNQFLQKIWWFEVFLIPLGELVMRTKNYKIGIWS